MLRLAIANGYRAVTARSLCAEAGVSTRTLYELYSDGKRGCFIDAVRAVLGELAQRVRRASVMASPSTEPLAAGIAAVLESLVETPQLTRFLLSAPFALGQPPGAGLERASEELYVGLLAPLNWSEREARPPPWLGSALGTALARLAGPARLQPGSLEEVARELAGWLLAYTSRHWEQLPRQVPAVEAVEPNRGERDAVVEEVAAVLARVGYDRLTRTALFELAGITPERFYTYFPDSTHAVLAVLDLYFRRACAVAQAAASRSKDRVRRFCRAALALGGYLASHPAAARALFVDSYTVGSLAYEQRERHLEGLADRYRQSAAGRPTPLVAVATVSAGWAFIRGVAEKAEAEAFAELAPTLAYIALVPTVGAARASVVIGEELRRWPSASVPISG
jgi:AcrR family transcriptional regulator